MLVIHSNFHQHHFQRIQGVCFFSKAECTSYALFIHNGIKLTMDMQPSHGKGNARYHGPFCGVCNLSVWTYHRRNKTSVTFPGWPGMPFTVASWNAGYYAKLFWPRHTSHQIMELFFFPKTRTCQFDIHIVTLGWKLIIKVSTVP